MRLLMTALLCLQFLLYTEMGFALDSKLKKDSAHLEERQAVKEAYYDWTHAIETAKGNPNSIVALYAPNAILLATLSPVIKRNLHSEASTELVNFTNADIREYFADFSKLPNLQVTTEKLYTQLFEDVAINTGIYTFTYTDPEGKKVDVPARFTFVYEKIGKDWLIINHHSSYLP